MALTLAVTPALSREAGEGAEAGEGEEAGEGIAEVLE